MQRLRPVGAFAWAVASVLLASALYAGYRSAPGLTPFLLENLRVTGVERTDPQAVVEATGLRPGLDLFGVDVERVRRATEALPWVRRARVVRQIPSTLTVEVEEWRPRALIRLDRLCYLARPDHVVRTPLTEGLDFPVVTGLTRADLDREGPLRRALLGALEALDGGMLADEVGEIHLDPATGVTVYTSAAGGTGLLLGFDHFEERLERLARLRRQLGRRHEEAYAVNLSYPDKIIARLTPAEGKDSRP